jgi:aspartyl/asparaginyl beta-hydroxylase (cupin superfamily)
MNKLWFSLFDFSFDYKGVEPSFIEPSCFRWTKDFQVHFDEIEKELDNYLKKNNLESYFNTSMVNNHEVWKTFSLISWDIEFFKRKKEFPVLMSIVTKYPEILSVSFNLLEANGKIIPHCGDTNGIYRCHFGMEIPDELPHCGFRVRDDFRSWKKGEWLIFMDAYNHEAFNTSQKKRIILVIDVLREEFKNKRNTIVSTVRTSLFLQKRINYKKYLINKPNLVYFLAIFLRPFAYIGIKLVNLLKIY